MHVASNLLETNVMNIIVWLFMGAVVGWIAGIIMGTNGEQSILLNIVIGIAGAMIGGWLISPQLSADTNKHGFSIMSFIVSLIGALLLLAILRLFQGSSLY